MRSSEKSFATENHALFLYFMPNFSISVLFKPKPTKIGKKVPASATNVFTAESESRMETSEAANFFRYLTSKSAFLGPRYSVGMP